MSSIHQIYALKDPRTDEIRYVGRTGRSTSWRLKKHLEEKKHTHKCRWVQGLKRKGLVPQLVVLEKCATREDADKAEKSWILSLLRSGFRLVNHRIGGEGAPEGYTHSEETRKKISTSLKGLPSPNCGRTHTPEARYNMSRAAKRRWEDEAYRKRTTERLRLHSAKGGSSPKLTASKTGRTQSAQTIEKRASKIRGTKWTPERRKKVQETWERKRKEKKNGVVEC